jgi:hypothetical protein
MTTEIVKPHVFKHGEYNIKIKKIDSHNDIFIEDAIMRPLTQEELADGWLQVISKRKDVIYHFSIYLSQLPSNLWKKVKRNYSIDKNKDYYIKIKNGNYHYTIKNSPNDELVFELYKNIMSTIPNINRIKELYKELNNNRVKGWIMIKAQTF